MSKLVKLNFKEHKEVLINTLPKLESKILAAADLISTSLKHEKKIMWCGNGGSASDSMHLSAELLGRFNKNRKPLNSISLTSDPATITCISNDFGYKEVFARQIKGLGKKGDVLIVISTSGNSENIIRALDEAKKNRIKTISLLGKGGGKSKGKSTIELIVQSQTTARIQEMHILIGHTLCELIEKKLKL